MRSDIFGSQRDRKSKTYFFTFLNVRFFESNGTKILTSDLSPLKFRSFPEENGSRGDPIEMKLHNVQMEK